MLDLLNPFLKYIAGGLAFVSLMLGVSLHFERVHSRKLTEQIAGLHAELQRVTTARDKQTVTTKRTVEEAHKGRSEAEPKARRVETAPLEGQCKTPASILSADI